MRALSRDSSTGQFAVGGHYGFVCSGSVSIAGYSGRQLSIQKAVALGVGYAPVERKTQGMVGNAGGSKHHAHASRFRGYRAVRASPPQAVSGTCVV